MRRKNWMTAASVVLVGGLLGAGRDDPGAGSGTTEQPTAPAALTNPAATPAPKPISDDKLIEIASEFPKWRRVSDQALYAPTMCIRPQVGTQRSASRDDATHGKKLYFLYAAKADEYVNLNSAVNDAVAPVGQTIVKQTFVPEAVPLGQVPDGSAISRDYSRRHAAEYLIEGDKAFKCGAKRELFIMTKLDAATPGTDQGWVYAVLTADGSKVLQSGAIASCMGCHAEARHDRQFGLALARMTTERVKKDAGVKGTEAAGQKQPVK